MLKCSIIRCGKHIRMSPHPCVAEGSQKTLFLVFGLAAKPLSNQNESGLPPIRIEWECAFVCICCWPVALHPTVECVHVHIL